MYAYEDRVKAVKLYIKYESLAATIRELGYPNNKKTLKKWFLEYQATGDLHKNYSNWPRYSSDQEKAAVNYYLEHGKNISKTIRDMGYPTREVLAEWVDRLSPGARKCRIKRGSVVKYPHEQKKKAVIELCARKGSAATVAESFGVSRYSLYKWKDELLGEEGSRIMKRTDKSSLPDDKKALLTTISDLNDQIYRQQMELDILKKAAEIIKKDQGIDPKMLSNKEKFILIDALRTIHPLNNLLSMVGMSKSSYFYQRNAHKKEDKYIDLREIVKVIFDDNNKRYGYRRIHAKVRKLGIIVSEKVIRKIMRDDDLIVPKKKRRKYKSYMGEISPAVDNIVSRDFHSDKPNTKWLTDLTEFHIPAGIVYLSPIRDCFDGLIVSWTMGTSPDAELVNVMLDEAIGTLQDDEKPIVHSDRGAHYRWPGWIERMSAAGLVRSMSKKGCSPDNAACEGFFGSLKNEFFYHRSWHGVTIEQFIEELDKYLRWYNEERIKMSLGAMSPLEFRNSIGLVA
jgi:transposase InsO family protein/transposase-like protein